MKSKALIKNESSRDKTFEQDYSKLRGQSYRKIRISENLSERTTVPSLKAESSFKV